MKISSVVGLCMAGARYSVAALAGRRFMSAQKPPGNLAEQSPPIISPEQAASELLKHNRIVVAHAASTPNSVLSAIADVAPYLRATKVIHTMLMLGDGAKRLVSAAEESPKLKLQTLFNGSLTRGSRDTIRVLFSMIPHVLMNAATQFGGFSTAFTCGAPVEGKGYPIGLTPDYTIAAALFGRYTHAVINENFPNIGPYIPFDWVNSCSFSDDPLPTIPKTEITPLHKKVGQNLRKAVNASLRTTIAAHVDFPDIVREFGCEPEYIGGCPVFNLQVGIGGFADAAVEALEGLPLRPNTELIAPGIFEFWKNSGPLFPISGTFALLDTQSAYKELEEYYKEGLVAMRPVNEINVDGPRHPYVFSINSCIQVGLRGDTFAHTFGGDRFQGIYSGYGGAIDWTQGAMQSPFGNSFVVTSSSIESKSSMPISRIVPVLSPWGEVTLPTGIGPVVVTEHGHTKPLRCLTGDQRLNDLVRIAPPEYRAELQSLGERLLAGEVMPENLFELPMYTGVPLEPLS